MPYSVEKRNQFLRVTFPTMSTATVSTPDRLYLALCKNDPEADGGVFDELTCDTYARVLLARKGQDLPDYMSAIANGAIDNVKQINFNRATVDWDQVKGIGLFEVATNGVPTFYAKLKDAISVKANQIFTFDPHTFVIQFADQDVEISAEASAN